ncbi:MAG: hypothetical protein ACR2H3_05095 [Acidimicrobiales bacterium]
MTAALALASLVGQSPCLPGQTCDLEHRLPWYFGVAIGAIWLAVTLGALILTARIIARLWRRRRGPTSDRLPMPAAPAYGVRPEPRQPPSGDQMLPPAAIELGPVSTDTDASADDQ